MDSKRTTARDSKRTTASFAAIAVIFHFAFSVFHSASAATALVTIEPAATALVTIAPGAELGAVKLMNSVNGGPIVSPVRGAQKRGNFEDWKALEIPMGRTHDCINGVSGGAHAVDIDVIFRDFDADENDPKNYDFVFTDHYLDNMVRAGTKPYFRRGESIEHGPKKYGVLPPKDFAKWARVCEHVIRHYNEGWGWATDKSYTTKNIAWSNQFNIVYWEIWNEPDLDPVDDPAKLPMGPRCWGGTVTNFFEFYTIAAKHLKSKFPALKIGGPAICGRFDWGRRFLEYCRDHEAPLDFFSWHIYATDPGRIAGRCREARKMLDETGHKNAESILNEWNYVKGWVDDWVYSLEVERGRFNQKAAAFIAGTMIDCQYAPLDHLMFYDARPVGMNSLFEYSSGWPMKGYYPFYAWKRLLDYGTTVKCSVVEGRGKKSNAATGVVWDDGTPKAGKEGFRAVAAKDKTGKLAVLIARYNEDNNVTDTATVTFKAPAEAIGARPRAYLTDAIRSYTEMPLRKAADGAWKLQMQPNAFAFVEF